MHHPILRMVHFALPLGNIGLLSANSRSVLLFFPSSRHWPRTLRARIAKRPVPQSVFLSFSNSPSCLSWITDEKLRKLHVLYRRPSFLSLIAGRRRVEVWVTLKSPTSPPTGGSIVQSAWPNPRQRTAAPPKCLWRLCSRWRRGKERAALPRLRRSAKFATLLCSLAPY